MLGLLACAMAASSCSLDETDYTEIEQGNYMRNASEAQNVLLGLYRNNVSDAMYGYHLSLFFTLPSDIARVEGTTTDNYRYIPCNAYTSSASEVQNTWGALYSAIYDCNDFVERLSTNVDSYTEKDRQLAAIYMAEARTLRAMYYFELVRWFGNVPLMETTAQSYMHPSTQKQADPVEVYKFIEKDLKYAVGVLPYAVDDSYRSSNDFRISKGAALGLLAKVYATWAGYPVQDESKWELAAQTAGTLVNSNRHDLLTDFEQLWKNAGAGTWDPTESLIEVSFYAPTVTGTQANDPMGRIGKWNGVTADESVKGGRNSACWRVLPTFVQNWENRDQDLRFDISVADHKYAVSNGVPGVKLPLSTAGDMDEAMSPTGNINVKKAYVIGMSPGKWDTEKYVPASNSIKDSNKSNINWYILRYADVLLIYAEALNELNQNPTTEAYAAINKVRRRAYGVPAGNPTTDLSGLSYEDFKEAVRTERAYELAFEGHRRQDLVRWGIYYETVKRVAVDLNMWGDGFAIYYLPSQYTRKNKNELLPIPLREMDLCPQYKQNPGW